MQHSVDGYFTVVLSHYKDKKRDGEVETWYLVPSVSRDWGKYMVQQHDSPPPNVVFFKTRDDASIAFADWMMGEWNDRLYWRSQPDLNHTDVQFVYAKVELFDAATHDRTRSGEALLFETGHEYQTALSEGEDLKGG